MTIMFRGREIVHPRLVMRCCKGLWHAGRGRHHRIAAPYGGPSNVHDFAPAKIKSKKSLRQSQAAENKGENKKQRLSLTAAKGLLFLIVLIRPGLAIRAEEGCFFGACVSTPKVGFNAPPPHKPS